jgi:anti-sigma regulatory factor (Ser/Thr protein kinase)
MSMWMTCGNVSDVRQARELVSRSLSDQSESSRGAAVLLVDECVTNAVLHGGGECELRVRRDSGTLRVEIADASPEPPVLLNPAPESERGRGLAIVNRLASRWGSEQAENGKVVWFELVLD